ncbi:MAG TPA: SDR family NAD(P)-dependent oxidoreductase [Stellaceae bacterium]|nr:SDR family NAD(P)-dependent oxidoreductase [Stellaceae bacterium]
MAGGLAGRHAVVTGGGSGIGSAIAVALAREGARVSLMGRNFDKLEAMVQHLTRSGAEAQGIGLDVTEAEAVPPAFTSATGRFGAVEILVNNAGAAESAPFAKTTLALLERMIAVNLTGAFSCTQAVLAGMERAKWGRIINIASTAGVTGYPYVSAYCAAKHALVGLTRALALETARRGVTVNAVCPGFTETELIERAIMTITAKTGRSAQEARAELAATNPLRRLIRPEEVAASVAFLSHPDQAAITGQAIIIAGGEVMA